MVEAVPLVDDHTLGRRGPFQRNNLSTTSVQRATPGSLECSLGKRGKGGLGRWIERFE
jgi:hypothetical protein